MTVEITYRRPDSHDETHLEWIVPAGWGEQAIRDAFAFQYGPQTEILAITPQP